MIEEIKIDSEKVRAKLVNFLLRETEAAGFHKVVIGMSGGVDSSLVAYLSCEALGRDNVSGIIMPYKNFNEKDLEDVKLITGILGIKTRIVDITPMVDEYFKKFPDADRIRRGNKIARERMAILYDQSKEFESLVVGTSNKTEILLGYGTLYGDTACAVNPIGNLYKTQVRQLAIHLGVPQQIVEKVPTAGLWPGQTDEDELGLTYKEVDKCLYYMVDKKANRKQLLEMGFEERFIDRVNNLIESSHFKRKLPLIAKIH